MIRDLTIGSPKGDGQECSPSTEELYQVFRKVMLKLTLSGIFWEVHEFRIKSLPRLQTPQETDCTEYPAVAIEEECNDDWCVGEFTLCQQPQT